LKYYSGCFFNSAANSNCYIEGETPRKH